MFTNVHHVHLFAQLMVQEKLTALREEGSQMAALLPGRAYVNRKRQTLQGKKESSGRWQLSGGSPRGSMPHNDRTVHRPRRTARSATESSQEIYCWESLGYEM